MLAGVLRLVETTQPRSWSKGELLTRIMAELLDFGYPWQGLRLQRFILKPKGLKLESADLANFVFALNPEAA